MSEEKESTQLIVAAQYKLPYPTPQQLADSTDEEWEKSLTIAEFAK